MKTMGKLEEERDRLFFDFGTTEDPEPDIQESMAKMGAGYGGISWDLGKRPEGEGLYWGTVYGHDRSQLIDFRDLLATTKNWAYDEP
jgi:hypothetical protein